MSNYSEDCLACVAAKSDATAEETVLALVCMFYNSKDYLIADIYGSFCEYHHTRASGIFEGAEKIMIEILDRGKTN